MAYDFDIAVIGLGPAGMAVSIMGAEMGLKVCAIERRALGGECMNVGCIPSKGLLRIAAARHTVTGFEALGLESMVPPALKAPFAKIQRDISYIGEKKTTSMFKKVDTLLLREGDARFVDSHTLAVGPRLISAKRIFICTGTHPAIPPIPGIQSVPYITNENMFSLEGVPESLLILGGGAIGCEMAQAFSRLGARCTIAHMDKHLLPAGDPAASLLLEKAFKGEGIAVHNGIQAAGVEMRDGQVVLTTKDGQEFTGEKLLVAAGRKPALASLGLESAGVDFNPRGVYVDGSLRTNVRHILAPGDCNGQFLLSHAAMHQGMIALMDCLIPAPFKLDYRKFVVPWTVFTEPQISAVGKLERQLKADGVDYEAVECRYEDYGAAIAENIPTGFVRAYVGKTGRILGAVIAGEGSGEMINEWGLAIQKKIRITDIMMLQHSFPSMSFLTKRVAETWMMKRMENPWIKRAIRWMF